MHSDPDDLGFEKFDAGIEFGAGVTIKTFTAEEACGVATSDRAVVFFHCTATSVAWPLLSTGPEARCRLLWRLRNRERSTMGWQLRKFGNFWGQT